MAGRLLTQTNESDDCSTVSERAESCLSLKVAKWQNLIPCFPWIAPGWRGGGAIQGKEGIKFCHLATLRREGQLSALSLTVLQSSLSLVCVSSRPFPALCGWMYMCARLAKGYQAILGQTFPRNEPGNAVFSVSLEKHF